MNCHILKNVSNVFVTAMKVTLEPKTASDPV